LTVKAAQRLLEYFSREGVDACFANPGTSEMHLVAAMDAAPGIRPILCLFEGVATGAADGYGRMKGAPALTLLHLGPGLGNGFANLHNAWRARTPIVSMVGEHATYHRANDAPLASDIAALARPVSAWLQTVERPADLIGLGAQALDAARRLGPAALIVPADVAWSDEEPKPPAAAKASESGETWAGDIDAAAKRLREGACALLIGGRAVSARACAAAERIARHTGAQALVETFPPRIERGAGRAALSRLPYLAEMAAGALASIKTLILVGAKDPVAFFALPGRPTRLAPDAAERMTLVEPGENPEAALEALAEALGAPPLPARESAPPALPGADAPLDAAGLSAALAATLPENAIVSDESVTLGLFAFDAAANAAPHDWLMLTGGSIGQGLPLATGAAVACRDRRVVALEADGSALYTIQALWTQAREGLDVTNVILNNGAYAILNLEMMRTGVTNASQAAGELFDLRRPSLDFTAVAAGFGVPASRVRTAHELAEALRRSFATPGPSLIEAMFP
jgi:acetolactate synthase I/II/III large subunit